MNQNSKETLWTALFSGTLGSSISLLVIELSRGEYFPNILYGWLIGTIIGLTARALFRQVFLNLNRHPSLCIILVGFVIAAGSSLGSWICGLRQWNYMLLIIGLAELAGLLFTGFMWHYSQKLNRHLQKRQTELKSFTNDEC